MEAYFIVVEEYDAVETSEEVQSRDNPIMALPPHRRSNYQRMDFTRGRVGNSVDALLDLVPGRERSNS